MISYYSDFDIHINAFNGRHGQPENIYIMVILLTLHDNPLDLPNKGTPSQGHPNLHQNFIMYCIKANLISCSVCVIIADKFI